MKRNAVYQSYYIQTNGHTEAGSRFVVGKSLNPSWVCLFSGFDVRILLGKVQAGSIKKQLSNIYTRIT